MIDNSNDYGLSDEEAGNILGQYNLGNLTTTSNSGGTAQSTNWFNSLAGLAGAGANAYATASGKKPAAKPTSNLLPIILVGAVGLVLVLVLALKR